MDDMNPAMAGLKGAAPMQGGMEMMGMDENMADGGAKALLMQAIQLHEGHLSGQVPTTPESQQALMDLLMQAIQSLS